MQNFVITIARGFGSGGKEIAARLAKSLGIHCYENRILTLASELSGLDEFSFYDVDEKLRGSYLINRLKQIPRAINFIVKDKEFDGDEKLFEYQEKIIKELVAAESCVIVGKCADYVLRDYPNVIRIYIEAPRKACIERTIDRMHISEQKADKMITKMDKYRTDYYKFYTNGGDWRNPTNYDFVLNSNRISEDDCIKLIQYYAKMKQYIE